MTNTKILGTPPELLSELERQTRFLLQVALTPMACPMCETAVNQVDAGQLMLDDFPAGDSSGLDFRCPHCDTELVYVVPLMGPVYQWRRKHPLPKKGDGA